MVEYIYDVWKQIFGKVLRSKQVFVFLRGVSKSLTGISDVKKEAQEVVFFRKSER